MSKSRKASHNKKAGALVYLVEELGDARLRCDQLQRYLDRAVKLIEQSDHKDHLFEVAGDLIKAVPETTFKLHKALQAVALAASRLDYEEIKQDLRPAKVDELERVLNDVRIRPVQRRSEPMDPVVAITTLRHLAAQVRKSSSLPIAEVVSFIETLEHKVSRPVTAEEVSERLELIAHAIANPPENASGPSRARLASMLREIVGKSIAQLPTEADISARVALRFQDRSAKDNSVAELKKLQKALEDIVVEAKKKDTKAISEIALKALKEVKLARFEEGKPADPTQHMSPEDAQAWQDHNEKYRDKFKEASSEEQWEMANEILKQGERHPAFKVITDSWKDVLKALADAKKKSDNAQKAGFGRTTDPDLILLGVVPALKEYAEEVAEVAQQLATRLKSSGSLRSAKTANALVDRFKLEIDSAILILKDAKKHYRNPKKDLTSAVHFIGMAVGQLEPEGQGPASELLFRAADHLRSSNLKPSPEFLSKEASDEEKAACDDDRRSRFEEGKPADPTEKMDPADAKKWKENTEEYGDKFKAAGDDEDRRSRFEEGKPADPTENMDSDDAKKWKDNTDKYEDKFKASSWKVDASSAQELKEMQA